MNEVEKVASYIQNLMSSLRMGAPYDTGNLRYNAIQVESLRYGVWRVFVNQDVAPYMPFTNEPWTSPKWNGAKNPNEGWWERETARVIIELSNFLSGEARQL